MKHLVLIAACLGIAACSNSGEVPVYKSVWERVKAFRSKEPSVGKVTPPRAEIDRLGVAMIQMNLAGEDIWSIMMPAAANRDYVVYANTFRQSLTLRESQITATRGLGTDLISATSSDNDPLRRLTPPSAWPTLVDRDYRFAGDGPEGRVERYSCALTKGDAGQVTLAGTNFDVVRFLERCDGKDGSFVNVYDADKVSGRVWVSLQYIGAGIGPLTLDILEPLDR